MDEFLILLQAKLDEAKSKGLINSDIAALQNQLDKLKLQAELDPKTISNLTKEIEKVINQKITISNINVDTSQVVKNAQQTGQKIGNAISQGVSSTVKNVRKEIENTINSISRLDAGKIINDLNLNRASVGTDITNQVRSLVSEINILGREVAKTGNDASWENLLDKTGKLSNILDTFGKTRSFPGMEDIKKFADYFNGKTISVGYKSSGLSGTDLSVKQLGKELGQLGVKFSATKQDAIELNSIWEEMCNATGRKDLLNITNAQDQLQTVIAELQKAQSILNGEKGLTSHPNTHGIVSEYMNAIEQARNAVVGFEGEISNLTQKESLSSTVSADTVIQNEERKQQAIQETAKIQEQLVKNGNIIQQTDFATSFGNKDEAEKYFNILSKTVSVQEKLGENKKLASFIVDVKNAEGVVEKLTYKYNELTGAFEYAGGSINNNGVIKQIDQISAKADSLQIRLDKLKANYSDVNVARPIKDSDNISALSQQYDKVTKAIENVRNADNATFSSMVSNAQREITALESMVAQFRNAENVATQMKSVDISSGIAQAQERLGKLRADSTGFEQMTQTLRELDAAITNVGDKSSLDAFIDKLRVAEAQLSRVKAETKSMTQVNKIQLSFDTGNYESKVESLIAKTKQWTDENGNARISTTALSTALDNLGNASKALSNNNTVENQKALIAAEKELDTQIKKVTNSVRSMNADLAKDTAVASLHSRVEEFMSKNGKAVKYFGTELNKILSQTAQGAQVSKTQLAQLEQSFTHIGIAARDAGKLGKTFFQTLRDGMKSFSYWTSSTFLVMKLIQSIKNGVSSVKALDTALVDLKKTTTMTSSELEDFYYSSNKVGKQMGVTTEEIINQAAAWSRLGYSSAEAATKMAKYSSMFASISPGMDIDDATDGLVSMMKAYNIGNNNPDDVLDSILSKINVIGNTAATSNAEIVNMLSKSSSAMAEANNTLEETIALETAAVEITRDDDSVGQAFKTISMRIRGKQTLPPYKEIYMLCA